MTSRTNATTFTTLSDREIAMERVFEAARELVFEAYTDPRHIPHWWGPRGMTTVVETMDVRPGGAWRYVQHDQEGNEYGFRGEYREVVPPARLVSTLEFEGMPGLILVNTAIFEEVDGKTKLTVTSLFASGDDLTGMIDSGGEAAARESWDRLAELLETLK